MIDVKSILADTFIKLIESNISFIVLFFVISILIFMFRHKIGYNFDLTRKERNRLSEKSLLALVVLGVSIVGFLFVKEYFFILSVLVSVTVAYFLYLLGFVDIMVEKLESRY